MRVAADLDAAGGLAFDVVTPGSQTLRDRPVEPAAEFLPALPRSELGNYRLTVKPGPGRQGGEVRRLGYSISPPGDITDFARIDPAALADFFGEDRYRTAADPEDLEKIISDRRIGQEVFPVVLTLLIVLFCLEQFVANRFYDREQSTDPEAATGRRTIVASLGLAGRNGGRAKAKSGGKAATGGRA